MSHLYLGTLGLVGSGKSTMAELLRRLGFLRLEEPFAANPFLSDFYSSGMKKGALQSQLFFLLRKWALIRSVKDLTKYFPVVVDPDIRVDTEMYARALRQLGSLSSEEYDLYRMAVEALMELLPTPDLLVYCRVRPETALARIASRGRQMEAVVTLEYLATQASCLEDWLAGYPGPVLVLDFDSLDATSLEGEAVVLEKVREALRLLRKGS